MDTSINSVQETKASAKDFFLNLGAIVALYTVVVALLNLLFRVINVSFPQTLNTYGYFGSQSISFPVATLIIVFPILVLLSWLLEKGYVAEPEKRHLAIKRWLSYITLFVAGVILAGDLVTVLYYFIDGEELTGGFLLKVLSVFVVALLVFMYYINDIRGRLTFSSRKLWTIISAVLIILSIVWGFAVLGSPRTQRLLKYDEQKITDLQNVSYQIESFYRLKKMLPAKLADITEVNYYVAQVDPQTGEPYEYRQTSGTNYELCAMFNSPSRNMMDSRTAPMMYEKGYAGNQFWDHPTGRFCFPQTADLTPYP